VLEDESRRYCLEPVARASDPLVCLAPQISSATFINHSRTRTVGVLDEPDHDPGNEHEDYQYWTNREVAASSTMTTGCGTSDGTEGTRGNQQNSASEPYHRVRLLAVLGSAPILLRRPRYLSFCPSGSSPC